MLFLCVFAYCCPQSPASEFILRFGSRLDRWPICASLLSCGIFVCWSSFFFLLYLLADNWRNDTKFSTASIREICFLFCVLFFMHFLGGTLYRLLDLCWFSSMLDLVSDLHFGRKTGQKAYNSFFFSFSRKRWTGRGIL